MPNNPASPLSRPARRVSVPPVPALQVRADERAAAVIDWLLNEERVRPGRTTVLLDRFVLRLRDAGLPLDRASLHIQQLHPQLAARSLVWTSDSDGAVELGHEHGVRNTKDFLASPVKLIFEGGGAIDRRLADPECPLEFPISRELKERGFSDYSIRPLLFSRDQQNAISLATRRPAGFGESDLAVIDAVLSTFSAVLELQQLRRTMRELLGTYVGPNTGERIFKGAIRRGDGELMHAVLWHCDLRGFTALSETEPLEEVIQLLNSYFDQVAAPVVEHGGEILKFIGDAVLAIFPCEAGGSAVCAAADAAMAAARAAVAGVESLNEQRRSQGRAPVACGVAVHIGQVMYGNIGAAGRLDFTVIGPAVNLVSRLQELCEALDCAVIVSGALARTSTHSFRSLGHHQFKGITAPQEAFTPS